MNDVYYHPEQFDLELVEMFERPDMSYEFDMLGVWKHADGTVYWAQDSGCSCPSPFEGFTSLELMNVVNHRNLDEFQRALSDFCNGESRLLVLIPETLVQVSALVAPVSKTEIKAAASSLEKIVAELSR